MIGVEIHAEERYARVQAGAIWADVVGPAGDHGLTALSGSSPDVGVVGYSLGGGISWIGRKYGLATNNIRALEVVTAEGRLIRVDAEHHEDLFWALRGGGGSFGVVTAIETELKPFSEIYAGMMAFPMERASEVLHAWREWHPTMPDEMTSVGRLLRVPPLPDVPEVVRGRNLVTLEAFFLGDEREGAELIQPLRDLGPELDGIGTMPTSALVHVHMDPEHPVPGVGDHMLLGDLPAEAIDAMVGAAGDHVDSPLLMVELRQLGGALARPEPGNGALASIDAEYAMFSVGMAMSPEMADAVEAALPRLKAAFAPYDSGREYLNFAEQATDPARFYTAEAYDRLRRVKAHYDPDEVFRANHPIPPKR
jgi:FAD/FMN-containing dehydrogenase